MIIYFLLVVITCFLIFQAGDTSVGWALGYMLTLSNLLPAERAEMRKALSPVVWGTLICFLILLLVAVLVFIILKFRDGRQKGSENVI